MEHPTEHNLVELLDLRSRQGAACRYVFHEMENGNHKQSTTIAPENCNRSDRVTVKSFALPTP